MTAPKRLAIFGATGTIGDNTLDLVRAHPEHFDVTILTGGSNAEKLICLTQEFQPGCVVIADKQLQDTVRNALPDSVQVLSGEAGLCEAAAYDYDCMVSAMVGFSALKPTLAAIRGGKQIALANKECLVAAGTLFMEECQAHNVRLIPVDSEHNGLFQLWAALDGQSPEHVTLTASGGPFRHHTLEGMRAVTPAQAVAHPNWTMGAKISVDSATLMNKGLELIEAQHLFSLRPEQLQVLVHPESIMHCLIGLADGSQLAQLCLPDMRTPLAHALHYPQRLPVNMPKLSLSNLGQLTFEAPDTERFPCLQLAYDAMREGHSAPAILNAANEMAVAAFLEKRIRFTDIPAVIDKTLCQTKPSIITCLDDVFHIDHITRIKTNEILDAWNHS